MRTSEMLGAQRRQHKLALGISQQSTADFCDHAAIHRLRIQISNPLREMGSLAAQLGPLFTLANSPDLVIEVAPDRAGASTSTALYAHQLICRCPDAARDTMSRLACRSR